MNARIILSNNDILTIPVKWECQGNGYKAILSASLIPKDAVRVDFLYDYFTAKVGEDGYFVIPGGATEGVFLTYFTERSNATHYSDFTHMGVYGMVKNGVAIVGIAEGMRYDFNLYTKKEDDIYSVYPRYELDGDKPYEDISVFYVEIKNGTYSDMAKIYRKYKMDNFGIKPLKERIKANHALEYAANSIEVRVRQAWKPVPSPVEEQTLENEPPVFPACTFERVGEIADEFKKQGIDHAEFCLVGWNIGGHDGRFPQIFPAEPKLGGDVNFKKIVEKLRNSQYNIVCHTSSTAAYRIADCFNEEYLVKNKDGSLMKRPYLWGGGRPYKICPKREYELFDTKDLEMLSQIGFYGMHYIDVITILPLIKCYDKNHPVSRKDTAEWYKKTMELCRSKIGGFASEAGFDFCAESLDYCLYTAFNILSNKKGALIDESIPFWELCYHGLILYNPSTDTLNYTAKSEKNRLKFFEYGGRPLVCFYANFAKGNNWMGLEDFTAETDEKLVESVAAIKRMYDDFNSMKNERFEFMESHRKISDGIYETVYSNGTRVIVDYNMEKVSIERI